MDSLCCFHAHPANLRSAAQGNFSAAVHDLWDEVKAYNASRCIGCYVICKLCFDGSKVDVPATLNSVVYIGKGDLSRAASHFPKDSSKAKSKALKLTKQQVAIIDLLSKKHKVGVIALHCCHTAVAFACEKVLIDHYKSSILNSYSGHKESFSSSALAQLEIAALEFLYCKISSCDFDLVY